MESACAAPCWCWPLSRMSVDVGGGLCRWIQAQDVLVQPAARTRVAVRLEQRQLGALGAAALRAAADARLGARADDAADGDKRREHAARAAAAAASAASAATAARAASARAGAARATAVGGDGVVAEAPARAAPLLVARHVRPPVQLVPTPARQIVSRDQLPLRSMQLLARKPAAVVEVGDQRLLGGGERGACDGAGAERVAEAPTLLGALGARAAATTNATTNATARVASIAVRGAAVAGGIGATAVTATATGGATAVTAANAAASTAAGFGVGGGSGGLLCEQPCQVRLNRPRELLSEQPRRPAAHGARLHKTVEERAW